MTDVAVSLAGKAGDDGLDRLREAGLAGRAPFLVTAQRFDAGHARLRQDPIGACAVASLNGTGPTFYRVRRTSELIRRSDPDCVCLVMPTAGFLRVSQERAEALLHPGEFAVYHTSRPYDGVCHPSGNSLGAVFLGVPRASLPTKPQRLRELVATVLRVPPPLARLAATCLPQLAADAADYPPMAAARISCIVVDLVVAVLSAATDTAPAEIAHDPPQPPGAAALTPREREVLTHIADGLTQAQAARAMHISPGTVDTYLKRIRQKLGAGNKADLTRRALGHGPAAR